MVQAAPNEGRQCIGMGQLPIKYRSVLEVDLSAKIGILKLMHGDERSAFKLIGGFFCSSGQRRIQCAICWNY